MYAHKMIVGENSTFAVDYNLPQQLRGLPLEIIILPITPKEMPVDKHLDEIINLAAFNDAKAVYVSPEINIAHIADEANL